MMLPSHHQPDPRPLTGARSRVARRGFALPLVLFLVLVAGIAAGILLEFQSNARLAVDRQVAAYRLHHTSHGIKELMDQWMLMAGANVEAQLGPGGLAFELSGGGGTTKVYLADGQGTALRDPMGFGGNRGTLAQQVSQLLAEVPVLDGEEELLRPAGPVTISANSAPRLVLEAVARSVTRNERGASALVQGLITRRNDKRLTAAEIKETAQKAGLEPPEVSAVESILTATPELWRIEVVAQAGLTGPRIRQGGLMQLPAGGLSLGQSGVIILSWDELPPE